ncbi:MAG: aspartate carbamoyltransferase catalytic subunit, partial [Ktedonobacterales bacterium]|nr:aspartate carbamoyltransferase catalytic subunit [Ktedonobacterales bacterium]
MGAGAGARTARARRGVAGARRRWHVTHHHLFDLQDWSAADLTAMLDLAERLRDQHSDEGKLGLLRGRSVITLFYETSTRTRVSFELAAHAIGADVATMTASGSSVEKGESLQDTIKTLDAMGPTIIVMRHPASGAAHTAAIWSRAAIVNAGDGWHAHPTQALLDLLTLREKLGDLAGKRVVILGDIQHSRVARSNCWALTTMGAQVTLCGPPTLLPTSFAAAYPDRAITCEYDVERALAGADVVMALRLQKERMEGGFLPSMREYRQQYGLTAARLAAYPDLLVMHPGPMNEGIEIDPDVA